MYPSVLCSTVYNSWNMKQPRGPQTDEWTRKLWYVYTKEYYSAMKRNAFESVLMRWMNLEPITQSEVGQKEKDKYYGRLQSMGSLRVRHDSVTSFSLFTFMHWRRKWQPTPVFLPGESQGRGSLVGCRLWGRTESDTTEVMQQQQQQQQQHCIYMESRNRVLKNLFPGQ